MSDLFTAIQHSALFPPEENPAQELFGQIQQQASEYTQQQQQRREELGNLVVNEWEYDIISQAIASAPDPDQERFRWASAIEYSRQLEKPVFETYTNLEALNEFWLGKSEAPRSNWLAVKDSFDMGRLSVEMGRLGGRWQDSDGADAELERQLDELAGKMEDLADRAPRPWYIQALKWGAQTAPFTIGPMLTYAAAGTLVGGPLGTVLGIAMAGAQSYELMRGLEYYKLRKSGVTHEIASPLAHISGGIQAGIEIALGNIPALASTLGTGAIRTVTGNVMKRLAISGKLGTIGRGIMSYAGQAFEEGVEEAAQELVSAGTLALAAELQGQGVDVPTAEQIARNVWESAKGGFIASLTMGIPGSIIGFRGDAAQSRVLTEMAGELGKEDFVKRAGAAELAMFEGMSQEQRTEALSRIWEARQARRQKAQQETQAKEEKAAQAEEAKEKIAGEVRRLAGGRLYTSEKAVTDTEAGEVRAVLKAGDPLTGERYGYVDYTVEGEQLAINRVAVRGGIGPEIRKEMVLDLMERHPGLEIQWEPTLPADLEIRRELVARNPRGETAGLQWYSTEEEIPGVLTREGLREKLVEYRQRLGLADDRQVDVALDWIDRNARFWGISTDEFLKGAYVPEMIAEGEPAGGLRSQRGATGFRTLGDTAKAILYFGQNADLSTWIHETTHGFLNFGLQHRGRSEVIDARMREIEKAFGVTDGNWEAVAPEKWQAWYREQAARTGASLSNQELLAYALEDYLRTGRAPSPQAKTVLQKIAEWLYGIYKTLRNRVELSGDIVAFFDRYMRETDSPLAGIAEQTERSAISETVREEHARAQLEQAPAKLAPADFRMPVETLDQAYALAEESREEFDAYVRAFAEPYGAEIRMREDLKKRERAEVKARGSAQGRVVDINAATLVFPTFESLWEAYADLVGRDEVLRVKNRFAELQETGYRDVLSNVRMANGAILEIQLHVRSMMQAKEEIGHQLYRIQRILQEESVSIDSEVERLFDQVVGAQRKVYDAAYSAASEARALSSVLASSRAFASLITDELLAISAALPPVASSSSFSPPARESLNALVGKLVLSTNTGTSSQSTQNLRSTDITSTSSIPESGEGINLDDLLFQGPAEERLLYQVAAPGGRPRRVLDQRQYHRRIADYYRDVAAREGTTTLPSRTFPLELDLDLQEGDLLLDPLTLRYGRELEVLKKFDPEQLVPTEDLVPANIEGRGDDSRRYAQWLSEGKTPPPIHVVQTYTGEFRITDGHRRYYAAQAASAPIYAWVSPVIEVEGRQLPLTLELAREGHGGEWIPRGELPLEQLQLFQNARLLFQGPKEALLEAAADFDSWEDFRAYVEAMFPPEELGEISRLSQEERNAWYRRTWEQAREVQPQTPAAEARVADEAFLESIRTDEGLKRFLQDLWEDAINTQAERQAAAYGLESEEELAGLEARREKAARVAREAHPLIHAAAIAVGMNRPVKPATLKAIRTMIAKAPREYRTLQAVVTGDIEALAQLERDLEARPEIKDPRWVKALAEGSIVERQRMARQIKNEELARKIRSGEVELSKDVQDYLLELREKQTEAQAKVREQEKELQEDRTYLSRYERKIVDLQTELKTYRRELDLVNKRISRLLERKAAIPNELLDQRSRIHREIQSIRNSVARARRQAGGNDARAIAHLNRIEAVAKLRDQIRARERERRAAKRIRDRMLQLGRRITAPSSASVHIDYADRIRDLQKAIDPKFRSAKTLSRLEASRKYYETDEGRQQIPPDVVERILKKPLNEWTLAELEELNERVENLRHLGRLRYHLERSHRRRFRQAEVQQAQRTLLGGEPPRKAVGRAKKTPWWTKVQLATLKPDRIALLLDGGKKGVFYRWLVERPNDAWNATMRAIDERVGKMRAKLDELGFTLDPLDPRIKSKGFEYIGQKIDVATKDYPQGFRFDDGSQPNLQDVLYWLVGMRNERTRAALLHGNAIPFPVIEKATSQLTPKQQALANFIQEEFEQNFDRVRKVARDSFNVDPEPEEFYVPMRRRDLSLEARGDEIAVDYAGRHGWLQEFVKKGFIKSRIDINETYQMPIRTDLVSLWFDSIQAEEAFIHQDEMIRDMHAVLEEVQTRRALQQRYGPDVNRWISKYINDLARDDIYGAKTSAERLQRMIRSNLVVSYLAFNVLSNAKQLVSVVPFLADAGPLRILGATGQWLSSKGKAMGKGKLIGNEFLEFVEERSPMVKHRSISREFEELKRLDGKLYSQVVKKIGAVGMKSLEVIDKVSVAIGWKAVYDKVLAQTGIEAEAVKAADAAVVRTQPSGRVQDMAEIYRSGDLMKWLTMFTSALNAFWNMISFDVPLAIKNGQILYAAGDLTAIAISGAGIALVAGALSGEDDEEKRRKLLLGVFSEYAESIPLFGSLAGAALHAALGEPTFAGGLEIFPAGQNLLKAVWAVGDAEYGRALANVAEGLGYSVGLPVAGPKKMIRAVEQQYLGAILGWRKD